MERPLAFSKIIRTFAPVIEKVTDIAEWSSGSSLGS